MEGGEKEENWLRILGPEVISSLRFLFASYIPALHVDSLPSEPQGKSSYIPLHINEANKLEMPIGTDKKSTIMTTKAYFPSQRTRNTYKILLLTSCLMMNEYVSLKPGTRQRHLFSTLYSIWNTWPG